jgi:methylated-DNA-[protein]-cysteine S-methyltransferase
MGYWEFHIRKTRTYLEQSKVLGNVITVQWLPMEKNLLWFVASHRVIGTDGSLTGYAGGLWQKMASGT